MNTVVYDAAVLVAANQLLLEPRMQARQGNLWLQLTRMMPMRFHSLKDRIEPPLYTGGSPYEQRHGLEIERHFLGLTQEIHTNRAIVPVARLGSRGE